MYPRRRLFLFSREWGIEQYSWRKCCDIFSEHVGKENADDLEPINMYCMDIVIIAFLNTLDVKKNLTHYREKCGRPDAVRTVKTFARTNVKAKLNLRQETDTLDQPHVDDTGMSETLWTTPMWDYFKMHCGG